MFEAADDAPEQRADHPRRVFLPDIAQELLLPQTLEQTLIARQLLCTGASIAADVGQIGIAAPHQRFVDGVQELDHRRRLIDQTHGGLLMAPYTFAETNLVAAAMHSNAVRQPVDRQCRVIGHDRLAPIFQ